MEPKEAKDYNKWLAEYFYKKPLYLDEPTQKKPNTRKLVEQPWQQAKGEMLDDVTDTLTDILFLSARTSICDIWQLLDDYSILNFNARSEVVLYKSFIAKHAQTLSKHDGQLIALLQHEGFPQAKKQIGIIQDKYKNPWIRTIQQITDNGNVCDENVKSIEMVSSWKFESSRAVGLAAKAKIAFHLIRLGEIGIIDIIKSCPFNQRISIRKLGILALISAEDGRYLTVAYENGEAEIIELEWGNNGLIKQTLICFIKYKLPEFESPVMYWNEYTIIYQDEVYGICSFDLNSGKTIALLPSDSSLISLELRSLTVQDNNVILALSSEMATQIFVVTNGKAEQICKIENTDTISICTCGSYKLATCFTNREVRIFEFKETAIEIMSTTLKNLPTCITYENESLIIPTVSDEIYIWQIDYCNTPERVEMPPTTTFSEVIRHIAIPDSAIILAVSQTFGSVFKISSESKNKASKVLALFVTLSDNYAVIKRDEEILLLKSNSNVEIMLSENKPRVFKFCIDGFDNLLLVCSDGTGVVLNCISESHFTVSGIPFSMASVVGNPNGGFWLADRLGDIYNIDITGSIQLSFTIKSKKAHVEQLLCTEKNLIWRGWVDDQIETGEAGPDALIFFEFFNENQLRMIGKRLYIKAEGYIETIEYDIFHQSVIAIFGGRNTENIGISSGTIEDYLIHNETYGAIDWGGSCIKLAKCTNANNLYLLSEAGNLCCFDFSTLKPRAFLIPTMPFQLISMGYSRNSEILIADNESKIFTSEIIDAF